MDHPEGSSLQKGGYASKCIAFFILERIGFKPLPVFFPPCVPFSSCHRHDRNRNSDLAGICFATGGFPPPQVLMMVLKMLSFTFLFVTKTEGRVTNRELDRGSNT